MVEAGDGTGENGVCRGCALKGKWRGASGEGIGVIGGTIIGGCHGYLGSQLLGVRVFRGYSD